MKKRYIILLVAVCLVSLLVVSCGKEKSKSADSLQESCETTEHDATEDLEVTTEPDEPEESGDTEDSNSTVYTYSELDKTMYAQTSVNVRRAPDTDGEKLGALNLNQEVKVTGQCNETMWYRIIYNDGAGYVSNEYLAETQVEVETEPKSEESQQEQAKDSLTVLNEMCDSILSRIINDGMSAQEKAYAIYCWVESNIRYGGVTDTSDWVNAAVATLSREKGTCYGFCSTSKALLTRAGIENIEIHSDTYGHYWNMINIDGNWWHFDTTIGWGTQRFMWTDAQMEAYTHGTCSYHWVRSDYPTTLVAED